MLAFVDNFGSSRLEDLGSTGKLCEAWTLPKVLAGIKLENLFIQKRVASCKKAGAFKCTASELLTFHAIFAYYVRTCVAKHFLQGECEVFLTMSLLVDMLQAASQGHAGVEPEALTAIADSVMRLMFKANWSQYLTRKFHWQLHFGDHWRRHQKLPGCFCMERKHKQITRYATMLQNISSYERSLYEEVVAHELHELQDWDVILSGTALVKPHLVPKKLFAMLQEIFKDEGLQSNDCWTATTARLEHGAQASKRDMCLLKSAGNNPWDCCEIWCHISIKTDLWTIGAIMGMVSIRKETNSATFKYNEDPILIKTQDLMAPVPFSQDGAEIRVLVPYQLRP